MKKIKLLSTVLAACVLFFLMLYVFFDKKKELNLSCQSTLIAKNDLISSRVRVSVYLLGENGGINLDGVANINNAEVYIIRRASSFKISHNGNRYIIYGSAVSELPGNTASADILTGIYPSFMLFNGKDYKFNLYRVAEDDYLLMSDRFVTLFCTH